MVPDDMDVEGEGQEPEPETGMDVEDVPAKGSVPVVTPILTAEQVMDMCTGAGRECLTVVDRCRANLFRACRYLSPGALPEDASLLRIVAEERVLFAKGDSDDETIRDRDLLADAVQDEIEGMD